MKYTIGIFLIVLSVLFAACELESSTPGNETNATNMTNASLFVDANNTEDTPDFGSGMSSETTQVQEEEETLVEEETTPALAENNGFDATFTEGDILEFKKELAQDPDGDTLRYTFSKPLNADGEWYTGVGDAGVYDITITASDGKLISTKTLKVQVLALNNKPIISNFADITIKEGETLQFNPSVIDVDNDEVTVTYSGFVTEDSYTTTYNDAGEHTVTLVASDGTDVTTKEITVTVTDVNRKPLVSQFATVEKTITEGDKITMTIDAQDPDGDKITVAFDEPLNENGEWQTALGDAGQHELSAKISDGVNTIEKSIDVTIIAQNNAPSITNFEDISVSEGDKIVLNPIVTDADGDEVTFKYTGYMTTNEKQTGFEDKGVYSVTLTATDGQVSTTKTIQIDVVDKNRAPVFNEDLFS